MIPEYFQSQNKAINLVALGINNGWIDATIHYRAYVDFGYNNSWRQLINDTQYSQLQEAYEAECKPLLQQCPGETGDDEACLNADNSCYENVEGVVEAGPPEYPDFDAYDIRQPSNDPYPPETYISYLQRTDIMSAIGAQVTYEDLGSAPMRRTTRLPIQVTILGHS